jgi:hypothetical protein
VLERTDKGRFKKAPFVLWEDVFDNCYYVRFLIIRNRTTKDFAYKPEWNHEASIYDDRRDANDPDFLFIEKRFWIPDLQNQHIGINLDCNCF